VEALAVAGQVGILQADIEVYPKMRLTWWSVLEEAARDRVLRRLVATVLQDPTVEGFHDEIRGLLDVPESDLTKEKPPRDRKDRKKSGGGLTPSVGNRVQLWPCGQVLRVRFLDGEPELHKRVAEAASQWLDYANLSFDFGDDPRAELRVSFKEPGSWSFLGTACLEIPDPQPNINFGWLTPTTEDSEIHRVVLHEFGHVLGLQHEQGNPASNIKFNKKAVYDYFRATSGWSRADVDSQFFAIWPPGYFPVHKVFDPHSIEMFPIPAELLESGEAIGWNIELSPVDKQFAAALYPQWERAS
jgi:hypothetical protein